MRFKDDLTTMLKARNTLIVVKSREEARAEREIMVAGVGAKYPMFIWDCVKGICDTEGNEVAAIQDPVAALQYVRDNKERRLYVFRDLHQWFDPIIIRSLKSLARDLQVTPPKEARAIVLLSPAMDIPPELSSVTVMDLPLPDRKEIGKLLDSIMENVPDSVAGMNGTRELAIESAIGLSAEEAGNCYSRSLVSKKAIDPAIIVAEKKRVILREGGLQWYEPDPRGMGALAGLDILTGWLDVRIKAFGAAARKFGLPSPKGVLLAGVSGCGKSLTAKCIASTWSMPLLRLDIAAQQSKYVGESGKNIRNSLKISEAVAPCVLWVDEIDKALAGATGPQGDGGVASDALGTLLTWMQEKTAPVFIVATANQVENLPPELLRKGRFDELFFVDLPTTAEREAILKVTLEKFERGNLDLRTQAVAAETKGFTGSEVAELVPEAMFAAFNEGERDITTEDLLTVACNIVPLSKTASEKIDGLRKWAKGKARFASSPETTAGAASERILDIEPVKASKKGNPNAN